MDTFTEMLDKIQQDIDQEVSFLTSNLSEEFIDELLNFTDQVILEDILSLDNNPERGEKKPTVNIKPKPIRHHLPCGYINCCAKRVVGIYCKAHHNNAIKKKACSFMWCERAKFKKGLCRRHYCDLFNKGLCMIKDCNKMTRARGYCAKHHYLFHKEGTCSEKDCTKMVRAKGVCQQHLKGTSFCKMNRCRNEGYMNGLCLHHYNKKYNK